MMLRFILTEYLEHALAQAEYDKLEDGTFAGKIPVCKGVIAFGKTLRECKDRPMTFAAKPLVPETVYTDRQEFRDYFYEFAMKAINMP